MLHPMQAKMMVEMNLGHFRGVYPIPTKQIETITNQLLQEFSSHGFAVHNDYDGTVIDRIEINEDTQSGKVQLEFISKSENQDD